MKRQKAEQQDILAPKKKNRDLSLDYIRGFAVFIMILAHTIHFFHTETNQYLRFLEGVGNTLAFTIFLFVAGAATYLAYLKNEERWKEKRNRIFRRIIYLIIGYYVIALASKISSFTWPPSIEWLKTIGNVAVFLDVPGFTEFIIPFIILTISLFPLRKIYKKISKSLLTTIITGLITFLAGTGLYLAKINYPISNIISLFAGYESYYRFPVFQYLIVFLLGLNWGNFITKEGKKEGRAFKLGLASFTIFAISYFVSQFANITFLDPLYRWPPSIGFITIGLAFSYIAIIFIYSLLKIKIIDPINRFFVYIGQDAFDMFIFSTFIILISTQILEIKFEGFGAVLLIFASIIGLTTLIASLNLFDSPSLFRKGTDIFTPRQKIFKKRYLILSSVMMIVVFTNLKIPIYSDIAGAVVQPEKIIDAKPIEKEAEIPWWDNEFGYYRQIEIKNSGPFVSIKPGETLKFPLNHNLLVQTDKSKENGQDMRLLYFSDEDGKFQEIEYKIENPNTVQSELLFNVVNKIYPRKYDNRYFIYYGNLTAEQRFNDFETNHPLGRYEANLSNEVKHPITTKVNHRWNLLDSTQENSKLIFSAKINDTELFGAPVTYEVLNTNVDGRMLLTDPSVYQAEIDTSKLGPGEYKIQAFAKTNIKGVQSQIVTIFVTYPMYVSWTIDWEGYNETKTALSRLEQISSKYDVFYTHFFNPRIYAAQDITDEQREFMTTWVKERNEEFNEPIGLHLHMHRDMVEAAGVEFRDSPVWANLPPNDGYAVPTTEYSAEEVAKMIKWGVGQFEENGIEKPIIYRAGGWFANLGVLSVLDDLGFSLDSSGRASESWWSRYKFWNLNSTTQPYKPSKLNQNIEEEPTLDLWEFPNNGGDTTAYEASDMIKKFTDNYSGGVLSERKLITYLSHPRWIDIDAPKMEEVLSYLENFKYSEDAGPVVYITLERAYEEWAGSTISENNGIQ